MTPRAYLVTSGSYSDYRVHRVYTDLEQATAFVRRVNEWDMRRSHDANVAAGLVPPNEHLACRDPIETCPSCGPYFANLSSWIVRVEFVPLYAPSTTGA